MRTAVTLILALLVPTGVHALEPVSALDDGFAVPSSATMTEAVYGFPGAESYIGDVFAAGAWSLPYGMDELAVTTGFAGYSTAGFGLSLAFTGTGFDLYGDEHGKLGLSWQPHHAVSGGIRLTRTAMRIRGFGNAAAWSSDIGTVIHPLESVFIAGVWEDVAAAELGDSEEPLDGRMRFAASWRAADAVTIVANASKVRRFDTSFSFGFIIRPADILTLGVSGANEPDRMEFLCGVTAGRVILSYRSSYHNELGMTHGFSICRRMSDVRR